MPVIATFGFPVGFGREQVLRYVPFLLFHFLEKRTFKTGRYPGGKGPRDRRKTQGPHGQPTKSAAVDPFVNPVIYNSRRGRTDTQFFFIPAIGLTSAVHELPTVLLCSSHIITYKTSKKNENDAQ